jgi:hypothetical protein
MATATANHLPDLALYGIRPALVEARLMTEKHACDPVYVATLAEELHDIEAQITDMEEAAGLCSSSDADHDMAYCACEEVRDANWIRTKSSQLNQRLHRIETSRRP